MPRTLRALRVACSTVVLCAFGAGVRAARAEALGHLDGELLGVTAPGLFSTPDGVVGAFTLDGRDGRDLRSAPDCGPFWGTDCANDGIDILDVPQSCASLQSLLDLSTAVLADDRKGAPLGRWVRESGARRARRSGRV